MKLRLCETCKQPADFRVTLLRDNASHLICRVCLKESVARAVVEAAIEHSRKVAQSQDKIIVDASDN